jgi:hypothetical protein
MLQITGIFARLKGGQYTTEKSMEDILNLTQSVDKDAENMSQ